MPSVLDKLKAYSWTSVAIAASTLLAAQTWRLHSAQSAKRCGLIFYLSFDKGC